MDLKFSALGIDPELRESGYYRVRENLNHECTDSLRPGFLGGMRKSYLWFKQDWNMRYGFTEMNTIASKLSSFAEDCAEHQDKDDGWFAFPAIPASNPRRDKSGRRWYVVFEREAREYLFSHSLTQRTHSCHLHNQ